MLRNFMIGLAALLVVVSCKSASTPQASAELTPQTIAQVLEDSAQANGVDAQRAIAANKPLLLVFWQSW